MAFGKKKPKKQKSTQKQPEKKKIVPKSVTDSIPYEYVYSDGIIEVEAGRFSRSYRLPAINFKTANDTDQLELAKKYAEFLTSFDAGTNIQITLINENVDVDKFREQVLIPMRSDSLNSYRQEYNTMLEQKMTGAKNNLETEKILTITIPADDIISAEEKFAQIDAMVGENLTLMAKTAVATDPLSLVERMDLLKKIYNHHDCNSGSVLQKRTINGHESVSFSLENCAAQGITTKDVIAPPSMEFNIKYAKLGDSLVKSFYISNYPSWIKGTILTEFASISANLLVSVHFKPMDQNAAINLVKHQRVNISSSIIDAQKKASKSGYSADLISPELQNAKEEATELLEKMREDNSKLFTVSFVITLFADSEEEMKGFEDQMKMIANKQLVTVKPLDFQQEIGLNSALPLGNNQLLADRLMTTQSVMSIIPFDVKEMRHPGGLYYGQNAVSRNMILYSRTEDVNPNGCILGMPGAGKSFAAKREMINVLLNTDDEIYVIDPESEYGVLAERFGGSVIKLANGSNVHINPFDLNKENTTEDGGDPVKVKMSFVETICEIMIGGRYGLSPIEQSIIDRSVMNIYEPYMLHLERTGLRQDPKKAPTIVDFYNDLCNQPQIEAQNLALALERYVHGGSDIFAYRTNVDIDNRFIVYDIKNLSGSLKELGLHIALDNIFNKMIQNKYVGKRTWLYADEFYLLMRTPNSAAYTADIWKRARKWQGIPCCITQNVEEMLKSEEARTVINTSAFKLLLGQTPINKQQLSQMFNISPAEQKYISSAKPGMGLILLGDESVIPMDDSFPKNTELYKIMTTKPEERIM